MRLSFLLAPALLVAVGLPPVSAADLSKIDRTLSDEPKYCTPTPKFCLLVFGPDARTRVWLVHDGDVIHLRASPNGKSPAQWRQVGRPPYGAFDLGDIWEDGGQVRYPSLRYLNSRYPKLSVVVEGKPQTAGRDSRGTLAFAASPHEAPIVHFNGPLTLDLFRLQQPFRSGQEEEMTAVVGTPGVGPGTFALFNTLAYPKDAWPTANIEFPTKDGGKLIVAQVRLAEE
jgi:hypothetical protein